MEELILQLPIQQIIETFKQSFDNCDEFNQLDEVKITQYIEEISNLIEEDNIQKIVDYIKTSKIFEIYINEFIAPLVPGELVGGNIIRQFMSSINVHEQILKQKQEVEGAVIIAPVMVAASLIQNAFLFIIEINGMNELNNIAIKENMDLETIKVHINEILFIPLLEVLKYRLMNENKPVPYFIVSTFGLINADYATHKIGELYEKIEETVKQLNTLQLRNDDESGMIN